MISDPGEPSQQAHDVKMTSMRGHHIGSMSVRRHFNVVCPLGLSLDVLLLNNFDLEVILSCTDIRQVKL